MSSIFARLRKWLRARSRASSPRRVIGPSIRASRPSKRRKARGRCSLVSAPTSSALGFSRTSSPKKNGKKPRRLLAARCAAARRSSASAASLSERDEKKDIPPFYEKLIRKVKPPIMIDTTDPAAIELALTYCQGKSIINSINLEDGEEKFQRTVPIAHEYGAAVVVGCIDEDPVQAQA